MATPTPTPRPSARERIERELYGEMRNPPNLHAVPMRVVERVIESLDSENDALRCENERMARQIYEREQDLLSLRAQLAAANEERDQKETALRNTQVLATREYHRAEAAGSRVRELEGDCRVLAGNYIAHPVVALSGYCINDLDAIASKYVGSEQSRLSAAPQPCPECESKAREIERMTKNLVYMNVMMDERDKTLRKLTDEAQERYRERLDRMVAAYISDADQWSVEDAPDDPALSEIVEQCAALIGRIDAHCAERKP